MDRNSRLWAIAVMSCALAACEHGGPPDVVVPPPDTTTTIELTVQSAPPVISYPGTGRANLIVKRNGSIVQDDLAPTVEVTGPFTARWESLRKELRTLKITATGVGSGTIKITTLGKSVSFSMAAAAVTFRRIGFTSWTATPSFSPNGCAISTEETIWCWGANDNLQVGATTPHRCGGSVCQYGATYDAPSPLPIESAQKFSQVVVTSASCNDYIERSCGRACALTSTGEAWCWGDFFGKPVRAAPTLTFKSLALGGSVPSKIQSCGVATDGKAYCFTPAGTTTVGNGMSFRALASGVAFFCGIEAAGDIWCWGTNYNGTLGIGNADSKTYNDPQRATTGGNFLAIDVGYNSTCALDAAGDIWCWGMGFVADGPSPPPSCGGGGIALCQTTPRRLEGGRKYVAVATPTAFSGVCGLTASGDVDCWDALNKPPESIQIPEPITSMTHGCGVSATPKVYCWGTKGSATVRF